MKLCTTVRVNWVLHRRSLSGHLVPIFWTTLSWKGTKFCQWCFQYLLALAFILIMSCEVTCCSRVRLCAGKCVFSDFAVLSPQRVITQTQTAQPTGISHLRGPRDGNAIKQTNFCIPLVDFQMLKGPWIQPR